MLKEKIIIVGAGGHAQSCIEVIEAQGKFKIMGLIGTEIELGREISGYQVIGTDKNLPSLASKIRNAIIGIGQLESSHLRKKLYLSLNESGFNLPAIISPKAHVSKSALVGSGTIVMHHALLNAGVRVGENCIINSKANIEHNSIIESHSHISTGATVNGGCSIGSGTFIGSGSVIKQGCTIGAESVIGMLISVRNDIPPKCLYTGERDL